MTVIDLAKSLGGKKRTRAATTASQTSAGSVRYGTATAVGTGTVTVTLDGSTSAVTLTTDAEVEKGDRVRVVSQGGSYAVVALKGIGAATTVANSAAKAAQDAATTAGNAAKDASAAKTAAQAAQDTADELSTLIRDTTEGVEVAKVTSAGAYSGVRALLTADALKFLSTAGAVLAEFGANVKTAGLKLFGGVATLLAGDKTVTVSDKEQATITGLDIKAPFVSVSGGDYLAEVGTSATIGGYDVSATLKTGSISGYYGKAAHSCTLGAYKTKTGEQHSAEMMLSSAPKVTITAVDSTSSTFPSNTLGVTNEGVQGGGKALYPSSKALATGVTAYRHMGWVVVVFNNYVPSSAEVTEGTHFHVGALGDGWKPPSMMKGQLYAGNPGYAAMAYVRSEKGASNDGEVAVYSNALGAGQQLSGYLIYPATR